jgi:hypothetical protein
MNHNNIGTLKWSPKLIGASSSKWWAVIECDPNLGKYYRHLFYLMTHRCYKLQRPAWECHITVVRDEEPPNKKLWEIYTASVNFQIIPKVETNGDYYWFPVICETALNIRESLWLPRQPKVPLHVSIGHGVD